jgi:hypothetical protein
MHPNLSQVPAIHHGQRESDPGRTGARREVSEGRSVTTNIDVLAETVRMLINASMPRDDLVKTKPFRELAAAAPHHELVLGSPESQRAQRVIALEQQIAMHRNAGATQDELETMKSWRELRALCGTSPVLYGRAL